MINDQDKRAIETMALCGCSVDTLVAMFPKVSKEDIIAICNASVDDKNDIDDSDSINISINCS